MKRLTWFGKWYLLNTTYHTHVHMNTWKLKTKFTWSYIEHNHWHTITHMNTMTQNYNGLQNWKLTVWKLTLKHRTVVRTTEIFLHEYKKSKTKRKGVNYNKDGLFQNLKPFTKKPTKNEKEKNNNKHNISMIEKARNILKIYNEHFQSS